MTPDPITVTTIKLHDGSIQCSAVVDAPLYRLVAQKYMGYSTKEAESRFRHHILQLSKGNRHAIT